MTPRSAGVTEAPVVFVSYSGDGPAGLQVVRDVDRRPEGLCGGRAGVVQLHRGEGSAEWCLTACVANDRPGYPHQTSDACKRMHLGLCWSPWLQMGMCGMTL
jgi:hypothetical protein